MDVLKAVETIGKDVLKGVEWPFKHLAHLAALLNDSMHDAPELKTAILALVQKLESISPDFAAAVTGDGLNLPADLKCVADAQVIFVYFRDSFLPIVEKCYSDLKKDVDALNVPDPVAAAPAPAVPAVSVGVHNNVPA